MVLKSGFRICTILLFTFAFFASCTKKETLSKVSVNFHSKANNSASSSANFETLIVNVSGPGMDLRFAKKECKDPGVDCSFIELDVLSGANRLIQLLVVYSDGTQDTKLFYGDSLQDISSDTQVHIAASEAGSFSTEAQFSGRYIPSTGVMAGKRLTGDVTMEFYPGSGKPSMEVQNFEIFGGWFHSFLLDNVQFIHKFRGWDEKGDLWNDVAIFNDINGGDGLSISDISPDANRIYKLSLKDGVSYFEEDNGVFISANFEKSLIGFYGQNPDNKHLCLDNNEALTFDDNKICTAISSTSCVGYANWPDNFELSLAQAGNITDCATAANINPAGNFWELKKSELHQRVNFSGFFGAFTQTESLTKLVDLDETTNTLSWNVDNTVFMAGMEVFTRLDSSGDLFQRDLVRDLKSEDYHCEDLQKFGFVSQGTHQNTYTHSDVANLHFRFALCPKRPDGGYYRTVMISRSRNPAPQFLKMAIYDSTGTPVGNFGFSDDFQNFEFPATALGEEKKYYIGYKNIHSQAVNIKQFQLNMSASYPYGSTYTTSSAFNLPGTLASQTKCDTIGASTLLPQEACYIEVNWDPSSSHCQLTNSPCTFHDELTVNVSEILGDMLEGRALLKVSFPYRKVYNVTTLASTFPEIDLSADLASGEFDRKAFRLYNNSSAAKAISITNSSSGEYSLETTCDGTLIPPSNFCDMELLLAGGSGASVGDGGGMISINGIGGGALTKPIHWHNGVNLKWNLTESEYNFGDIPHASTPNQKIADIDNPSTENIEIVAGVAEGLDFDFYTQGCTMDNFPVGVANGSPCELYMKAKNTAMKPPGEKQDRFYFYYHLGHTFRIFEKSLRANFL